MLYLIGEIEKNVNQNQNINDSPLYLPAKLY